MQYARILKIYEYLQRNHTASITELSSLLGVSVVTIRKDLAVMEENGQIIKTHGGAALAVSPSEPASSSRFPIGVERTAELATQCVEPGDFIFLGSGRTCLSLADKIKDVENISVITNNVSAINVLCPKVRNLILLGGEIISGLDGYIHTINSDIESALGGIYFNKAFTSGVGIDINAGLTVNTMGSIYLDKMIPGLCNSWYVMMDSSKFGIKAFYQSARLDQISCLVTDLEDQKVVSAYQAKGLHVISPLDRK